MKNKNITNRYAQTLLIIAEEKNVISEFVDGLAIVEEEINSSPMVQYAWFRNQLSRHEKKEVVTNHFDKKIHELLLNFLCLLIDKNREEYLFDIIKEFSNISNLQTGHLDVKLGTAFELSEEVKEKISASLTKITGKNVRLEIEILPEIIGGMVLKINDKVFDSSILKRLSLLQEELKVKPTFEDNYLKKFISKLEEKEDLSGADMVAEVSSPVTLSDERIKTIEQALSKKMGQQVVVYVKHDPSLIGGLTVKVGDKIVDGSVKRQLNLMENDISKVLENWGEGLK